MPTQNGDVELYDMDAELKHETEDAFLVTDGADNYWLPKSLTENNGDGTFTLPRWLAEKKGIV